MKNYVKIMREMLKRRQFIFGKQNINRHQPYVDGVVIEGAVDAVMKFCPSKADVMYVLDHYFDDDPDGLSFNVSEKDLEFFGTFLYSVRGIYTKSTRDSASHDYSRDICHIGYIYKLTGGTYTELGSSEESIKGVCILLPGPALVSENKTVFPNIRRLLGSSEYDRIEEGFGGNPITNKALAGDIMGRPSNFTDWYADISTGGINSNFEGTEITVFDNIGDTITLEPSIMKYLEDKICFSEYGFPSSNAPETE